jgi:hypothetical protein
VAQDNRQHTRWACQDFRWPTPRELRQAGSPGRAEALLERANRAFEPVFNADWCRVRELADGDSNLDSELTEDLVNALDQQFDRRDEARQVLSEWRVIAGMSSDERHHLERRVEQDRGRNTADRQDLERVLVLTPAARRTPAARPAARRPRRTSSGSRTSSADPGDDPDLPAPASRRPEAPSPLALGPRRDWHRWVQERLNAAAEAVRRREQVADQARLRRPPVDPDEAETLTCLRCAKRIEAAIE